MTLIGVPTRPKHLHRQARTCVADLLADHKTVVLCGVSLRCSRSLSVLAGPRASSGRSVRLPARGIGLLGDPCEVVRVSVDDRTCGYAGDLVGMLNLGAGNDLGYPFTAGVQRCPDKPARAAY